MWADRSKWALLLTCLFVLPFWNLSELWMYLPFLFQFQKPGQASPLSLLLLWLSSYVFGSGTNNSPILCKLPGSFCKLLQFRTIRVYRTTTWTVCLHSLAFQNSVGTNTIQVWFLGPFASVRKSQVIEPHSENLEAMFYYLPSLPLFCTNMALFSE